MEGAEVSFWLAYRVIYQCRAHLGPGQLKELPMARPRSSLFMFVLLGFGALSTLHVFLCPTSAATTSSADPNSSCASAEYAAQKLQQTQQQQHSSTSGAQSDSPTLFVVPGTPPLNTEREIRLGRSVTVCIMGLHHWIYARRNDPTTLR